MDFKQLSRRRLFELAGAVSVVGGAATPFAMQLAAAGAAAAAGAPDYKALICIFQFGGNDSNNSVVATDADSFGRYFATRNIGAQPIALMPAGQAPTAIGAVDPTTNRTVTAMNQPEAWGGVLPVTPKTQQAVPLGTNATSRTFGLHPALSPLMPIWGAGRLAIVANVGTLIGPLTKTQFQNKTAAIPSNLFSHNDQQSTWQAGTIEGANIGWGGQLADLFYSANGANAIFTGISTDGNAVFLSGRQILQYQVTNNASPSLALNGVTGNYLFGSSAAPAILKTIITDNSSVSDFQSDYANVVQRSLNAQGALANAMSLPAVTAIPALPTYTNPTTGKVIANPLAVQINTIARIMAAAPSLGVKRQVFFMGVSGHDNHDGQNDAQPNNLSMLANAMAYLDGLLSNLGGYDMRSAVTTFTASDFNRTFASNGDGTDHAWGGHHFVMGGAVRGGDMYGQFPTWGIDDKTKGFNNPDAYGSVLIPTTSVDQYAATLGKWFGASDSDLAAIFPNLKNFNRANLGFI